MPVTTEAFVVRLTPFGETDRIVELLTPGLGRVSALARGARRSRKRFGAALDYFHRLEACLKRGRGDLWRLETVDLVRPCTLPDENLDAFDVACQVLAVARLGSREGDADPGLFVLVASVLEALCAGAEPQSLARVFRIRALQVFGYALAFDCCPHCGKGLADGAALGGGGEVLCPECSTPGGRRLSPGAVRTLEAATAADPARLGTLRISLPIRAELDPVLDLALEAAVGVGPRTHQGGSQGRCTLHRG